MVRLLHLSDIHFSVRGGEADINVEDSVRERMMADIRGVHDDLGDVDAVLVVGDIADWGQENEYAIAADFLDRVCDTVGCDRDQVVCVPGNHDIDRGVHKAVHGALRHQLRTIDGPAISNTLRELLAEPTGAQVLLSPLQNYNAFALRYGCDIAPGRPMWTPKVITVGTRELEIHGVTSSWICDATDSHETDGQKVVAGLFQFAPVGRTPERISVVLCHHPERWLRDADQIRPWLNKAHIVLTGHEHEAGITPSPDGRSLRIASGAVNPDRTEGGWIPAYNVIELEIDPENPEQLAVCIHVRSWQRGRAEFGPDQDRPEVSETIRLTPAPASAEEDPAVDVTAPEPEPIESDARAMLYRVMRSSPDERERVARDLGLLHADDGVYGLAADRLLLRRSFETDMLGELDRKLRNE